MSLMNKPLSNIDVVTLAVYLLGGQSQYVDTEDIAVKVNEIAPGRFTWRKYHHQINIDNVRKRLSDGKDPKKGGYLFGSFKKGWILTTNGLKFAQERIRDLQDANLARTPMSREEMNWRRREKTRMLASVAFDKLKSQGADDVSVQDAEAFFRVDDYVTGEARERKLVRILNTFDDDPELGQAVKILAKKVRKK